MSRTWLHVPLTFRSYRHHIFQFLSVNPLRASVGIVSIMNTTPHSSNSPQIQEHLSSLRGASIYSCYFHPTLLQNPSFCIFVVSKLHTIQRHSLQNVPRAGNITFKRSGAVPGRRSCFRLDALVVVEVTIPVNQAEPRLRGGSLFFHRRPDCVRDQVHGLSACCLLSCNAVVVQISEHGQIQHALLCSGVQTICDPFCVRPFCPKLTIQQIFITPSTVFGFLYFRISVYS